MIPDTIRALRPELEHLVIESFRLMIERSERDPDYGLVDMKLNLITGEDFPAGDPARRSIYDRDVVYGITQGRAIESLAKHISWLPPAEDELRERARVILRRAVRQLEDLRAALGGHMSFMMSRRDRCALRIDAAGAVLPFAPEPATTMTDLFYAKGLMSAARCLDDATLAATADATWAEVIAVILQGTLANDRQAMDPKNPVTPVPGRITHAPYMLALGGVADAIDFGQGAHYGPIAAQLMRDAMSTYLNRGQWPDLQPLDFTEYIDPAGRPWRDAQGRVWCDPGHALEFVGLASKVVLRLDAAGDTATLPYLLPVVADVFPGMIAHTVDFAYNTDAGGICKAYDLLHRQPINSDMPWWNLAETMRAATNVIALCPDADGDALARTTDTCHRAYMSGFTRPDLRGHAVQTRAADGQVIDVIPAMPDADPCYHTGLSLIDVIATIDRP